MKLQAVKFTIATLMMAIPTVASAQFVEDAQRLAMPGFGVGARALGMGDAYGAVASDYSALLWNPAGLAQAQMGEFSFGLSYFAPQDVSTYFGNQTSDNANATNLNSLGFVLPVPVRRGSFSIAFGYTRQSNFTTGMSFSGYNPNSTIIQSDGWAPDHSPYPPEISLAEQLQLATIDTATGLFVSPIKGGFTQSGTVTESGGLNNWMFGGAMDVGPNLSLGVTLTYVSGSYRYDRSYKEQDTKGAHQGLRFNGVMYDLNELDVTDFIEDNISGFNAKFGLMYREPNKYRIGFTIKTPTAFNIDESFGTTATSIFWTPDASGNNTYGPITGNNGSSKYDVTTPWVFGASASVIIQNLVLSGDAEYTDWTATQFSNASQDVLNQNSDFATTFQGTINLRGGAEYEIPSLGMRLRGGFIYNPSIYKGDPSSFNQKYVTGGVGFSLGESSMIDVAYAYGWRNDYRVNYDATSPVQEKVTSNLVLATFTHRF